LTVDTESVERELALVKVTGKGNDRVEALRMSEAFRARVIDATPESFVFEVTGDSAKISAFISLMSRWDCRRCRVPASPRLHAGRKRCRPNVILMRVRDF